MGWRGAPAIALFAALALALPAAALDLDTAKRQGLVGETMSGYLAAVASSPSPDVAALVAEVNAKRAAGYREIATRNGTAVEAVAALAGQKLIDRASPGDWIGDANGRWYQKK
jgi:uncharacterized protein YdbL (DUF1318 family)